jgi:drug/metabolite transporter (DMT)-like permease
LNLLLTVTVPIIDKKLTNDLNQEQTSTGISTLKNILSCPMILLIAYLKGTLPSVVNDLPYLPVYDYVILFFTIFFGTTIGIAYYSLMSLISATSVVAANVTYKLVTLSLSLIIFPVPFKLHGVLGLVLSFFGVGWYSYMRNQKENRVVIWKFVLVGTIMTIILYAFLVMFPIN